MIINKSKLFMLSLILVLILIVTACRGVDDNQAISSKEAGSSELKTHLDEKFGFKVNYPANWTSEVEKWREGTETQEASPDAGVRLYIDGNPTEVIYVFGQVSTLIPIARLEEEVENFMTDTKLKSTLRRSESEGRTEIQLVFDTGDLSVKSYKGRALGAFVSVDVDTYQDKEAQIIQVLKSIEVL